MQQALFDWLVEVQSIMKACIPKLYMKWFITNNNYISLLQGVKLWLVKCGKHCSTGLLRYAKSRWQTDQSQCSTQQPSGSMGTTCSRWKRKCKKTRDSSWVTSGSKGEWRNTCLFGGWTSALYCQWMSGKSISLAFWRMPWASRYGLRSLWASMSQLWTWTRYHFMKIKSAFKKSYNTGSGHSRGWDPPHHQTENHLPHHPVLPRRPCTLILYSKGRAPISRTS